MRIWINDTQLDTYEGSVSVTKTNNLWKFGKAEFVHTQTVKIPATNNNKALLDFADEFRTQSSVARGFVDCLVDIDGVFEQGRLYVSGYADGEFSVIMTFGKELQSLDVKIADVLGEYVDVNKLVGADNDFKQLILYDNDESKITRFCVTFSYIMQMLRNKGFDIIDYNAFNTGYFGYAVDYNSTNVGDVGVDKAVGLTRVYGTKSTSPTNKKVLYTYTFDYANLNAYRSKTKYTVNMSIAMDGASVYARYYAAIEYFAFPFDVILHFGSGCSDYAVGFVGTGKEYISAFDTLYGHYRDAGWEEVNNDLSNTDLRIHSGTKFAILRYGDFYQGMVSHPTIPGAFLNVQGLFYADYGGASNSFPNITIKLPVFNYNFIPDITIYQMLQILSAYSQKLFYFNGSKFTLATISDVKGGNTTYQTKDIEIGYSVDDKAFDFAQNNYIKCKTGGNDINYKIENLHISEDNTILEIPFDGGAAYNGQYFKLYDKLPAIGVFGPFYFNFAFISKISGLQDMLGATRQVKIKFRMSYLDFVGIKELDNFEYKGARLQWSSLQWSDGWCTATLQTIY